MTAFALRRRLAIDLLPVDPDEVLAVSLETGLTIYDGAYLWLARRMAAELVTLDVASRAPATSAGRT
jgi:predicted nucleic acid-binding protein